MMWVFFAFARRASVCSEYDLKTDDVYPGAGPGLSTETGEPSIEIRDTSEPAVPEGSSSATGRFWEPPT